MPTLITQSQVAAIKEHKSKVPNFAKGFGGFTRGKLLSKCAAGTGEKHLGTSLKEMAKGVYYPAKLQTLGEAKIPSINKDTGTEDSSLAMKARFFVRFGTTDSFADELGNKMIKNGALQTK